MPSGGVFSSGSGLRLQATTPGVSDVGNAHVSGVLLADRAVDSRGGKPASTGLHVFGTMPTFFGSPVYPDNVGLKTVVVGESNWIGTVSTVYAPQYCVLVGVGASVGGFMDTVVGWNAYAGGRYQWGDITPSACVAIGAGSEASVGTGGTGNPQGAIAIGVSSVANGGPSGSGGFGSIAIGMMAKSRARQTIVLGSNIDVNVPNSIFIGFNKTSPFDGNVANSIVIGDPSHTEVRIGGYHLSGSMREVYFRQTTDKAVTGTAETSLLGTGAGTTTLEELKAGSQIGLEGWASVAWPNAGTVVLRLKLGGTTILQTAAIPITAGSTFGSHIRAEISVRAGGAGGSVVAAVSLDSGGIPNRIQVVAAPVAVDLSSAVALDLTAEISNAGDSITSRLACVEVAK